MIRRSMAELYESIREFFVAVDDENRVVGCVALHVFWEDLAEIRCLAVAEHVQGLGVGRRLVEACWESARELEIKSVFALTNAVGFFERCGYHQIDKSELPQRIWNECVRCPVVSELPGNRAHSLDRARAGDRRSGAEPGVRRDLTRSRNDAPDGRVTQLAANACLALCECQSPGRSLLVGLGVSLATAVLMLATEPRMAIGWDEGYTLGREARLRDWFRGLRDPVRFAAHGSPARCRTSWSSGTTQHSPPVADQLDTRSKLLFDREVLAWFWPFAREEPHGHPPFYALLGLAGDVLAPSWQDLPRARLGPILLFSLTAGAIYRFVVARWGGWAAALAGGCLGLAAEPVWTRPLRGLRRRSDVALGPGDHRLRAGRRSRRIRPHTTAQRDGAGR